MILKSPVVRLAVAAVDLGDIRVPDTGYLLGYQTKIETKIMILKSHVALLAVYHANDHVPDIGSLLDYDSC